MKHGIFAFIVIIAATAIASGADAADAMVVMKNFDFSPMDVTIAPGTTVTWKNLDGEPHTVASRDGLFRSPALDQNDTFQFKFDRPGVYEYVCSIHPKMMATITVTGK
jgi:plastocyanin